MSDDAQASGRGWFAGIGRGSMSTNLKIGGLDEAVKQLGTLTSSLSQLTSQLTTLNQQQATLASGLNNVIKGIGASAQQAAGGVNNFNNAVNNTTSGSGSINKLFAVASQVGGSDIFKDLAMFPLRYTTQQIDTNRQLAMNVSAGLAGQTYATGASAATLMGQLGRFPGNVRGSAEDLIGLVQQMRQYGAFLDLGQQGTAGNQNQGSNRTVGFLQAVQQAQKITPGTPATAIAQTIGGFSANTQAQQQAQMITGGAYAMIAAGGRHKSLSEWCEDILNWLVGLRPGTMKGKMFTYGELMAQYFPGSNIDSWFNVNGVPEGMKEYWWNYVLNKSRRTGPAAAVGTQVTIEAESPTGVGNQAWERLKSVTSQTRGQFNLGAQMAGSYANKEQANRWFNDLMAQVQGQVLPAQVSKGALQATQYLPDALQELLMGLLERGGSTGALIGGALGYGLKGPVSLAKNLMQMLAGGLPADIMPEATMSATLSGGMMGLAGATGLPQSLIDLIPGLQDLLTPGDVPDYGDSDPGYGPHGRQSTTGMHPDMRRKMGAMMRANPKLRINSGFRDTVIQRNLKSKGVGQVSGQPSAHTRGQAADLGPSSEYGWIVRNAKRFGLKSGAGFGEPWHVGMGDPQDTSTLEGTLGGLFGLLTGSPDKNDIIQSIGGLVPAVMRIFFGMFGGMEGLKSTDIENLAYDPEVFNLLRGSGSYTFGGLPGSQYIPSIASWSSALTNPVTAPFVPPGLAGGSASGPAGGATTLAGQLDRLGIAHSGMSAGAMVALLAYKAGFRGMEDLSNVVGISQRESGWDPTVTNMVGRDNSYGLMQINMKDDDPGNPGMGRRLLQQFQAAGIDMDAYEDLKNPYINLQAAYNLSNSGSYWRPWTTGGSPFNNWRISRQDAEAAVREAGVGDPMANYIDVQSMQSFGSTPRGGNTIAFKNTFVIQGGSGGPPSNGGIDTRRVASQIADQLEQQVRDRLSRTN